MSKPSPEQIAAVAPKGYWCVIRHGGRSTDSWKLRVGYEDDTEALGEFCLRRAEIRQGGLAVIAHDGSLYKYYEAPRLRSRW